MREESPNLLVEKLKALHDGEFRDFEVIVVDDCSPVDMRPFTGYPLVSRSLRLDDPAPCNLSAAVNEGVKLARARWLAISDVDVAFGSGALKLLVESGDRDPVAAVIGQTLIREGKGYAPHPQWERRICCLAIVARWAFESIGGFPRELAGRYGYEDDLFLARLRRQGRIITVDAAQARMDRPDRGRTTRDRDTLLDIQHNRQKFFEIIRAEGLEP